jgi:predicted DCC family thiol-disulfide oxidoreductase YuxK
VATAKKPLLVYDGDCGFCRRWIARWKTITGERVAYMPSQDYAPSHPEIKPEEFAGSVQLFENDRHYAGAEAVYRTLAHVPGHGLWLKIYQKVPPFAWASETFYRLVARHRAIFSKLTTWFWGQDLEAPAYGVSRWLFTRMMGLIYLAAFASLWAQADGLIGANGILPFTSFLDAVRQHYASHAYSLVPTLLWLNPSDSFLHILCGAGTVLSLLVLFDVAPGPCLLILWALYFSLVQIGGDFFSFQWDMLLLETGFLAAFFAPWRLRPRGRETEPSTVMLWLLRFLLFRLMFESGCVKLLSGDSTWRDWTALYFHYETQPLPTWLGWYAHQLPRAFQRFSVATMFAVELGTPWLIFLPRRPRMLAGLAVAGLMALIALTGNYCFFNLLTVALCLTLFDDAFWKHLLSKGAIRWVLPRETVPAWSWRGRAYGILALPIVLAGLLQVLGLFEGRLSVPSWVAGGFETIESLRLVNSYGLFAVMTRPRNEIAVEGSDDGQTWREYSFKWKPGELDRRPGFVEPFQPRLDWQMWFAALGSYQDNRWFLNFMARLMQGKPEVLALLARNPFPLAPPHYLRASLYEYHFTTWAEKRASGNWWTREFKRPYCPILAARRQ